MATKWKRDGFHTVTPYLVVQDAGRQMTFLGEAFGARETFRTNRPDGSIMHAECVIGDSPVMMGEATGDWGPVQANLYLAVEDTDAVHARALGAGAVSVMEPSDQFYGDRMAGVKDPAGNTWWIATHKEDISPEEMERRQAEMARE